MFNNPLYFQRIFLVCAVFFVFVALAIILGVIPPVKADTHPGVKHDKVALIFWINGLLTLFCALILFIVYFKSVDRNPLSTSFLVIAGIIPLLLGLAITDAASDYLKHGPAMQSASVILFICAIIDILGGMTVLITALARPKKS